MAAPTLGCSLGDARYVSGCVAGAAESYIDDTWTPGRSLGLCRQAPNAAKGACYAMVGARMAEHRLKALRYPNDVVADVVKLVEMHLRFHTYRMGWSDGALRRYVRDAPAVPDRAATGPYRLPRRADRARQCPDRGARAPF